ncbi:MAG: hypothetical protein ACLQJR_22430 [Stellaceae bacterium]
MEMFFRQRRGFSFSLKITARFLALILLFAGSGAILISGNSLRAILSVAAAIGGENTVSAQSPPAPNATPPDSRSDRAHDDAKSPEPQRRPRLHLDSPSPRNRRDVQADRIVRIRGEALCGGGV